MLCCRCGSKFLSWKSITQRQLLTLILLFGLSTLGLVLLTGSHLDAAASFPRRQQGVQSTAFRMRSFLEYDDVSQVRRSARKSAETCIMVMMANCHLEAPRSHFVA